MKLNDLKLALLAGTNLAANAFASVGHTPASLPAESVGLIEPAAAEINTMSLVSIEKSFLTIPPMCKARSAAFDPKPTGVEVVSEAIQSIHAALEGEVA